MLLVSHTFVGVAIASTIPNPYIAAPLSFAMHFLGDMVPHWDFYSKTKKEDRLVGWRPIAVMADLVIGVAIGLTSTLYALWVLKNQHLALNIFLCGIASVLPDVLEAPHIFMTREPKFLELITKVQKRMQFQAPLPWGMITQLLVILVSLLLISNSIIL